MDDALVERVLRAVDLVPRGRVVSYGDVAELVGTGPRQIGAIMSRYGHHTWWWRVTNAAGDFPAELRERAFAHWADEGISVKPNGRGCRIRACRADLFAWAERYDDLAGRAGAISERGTPATRTPPPETPRPPPRAPARP